MTNELNYDSIELMETTQARFDYSELENLMGERSRDALRLDFDRKLKVEFHGTKVTSDAGSTKESKAMVTANTQSQTD